MKYILSGLVIILILLFIFTRSENFDIPLRSSSAWDWNTGPGYGAGYGTGYSMYGVWPATIPGRPWKPWMWGRRPLIFTTPFTPVPQIDYLRDRDPIGEPQTNFNVSIDASKRISIDGIPGKALQLDRRRNYYFHVYTPGAPFMITSDGETPYGFPPLEVGTVTLNFDESSPNMLFYKIGGINNSGGVIYLN